MKQMFGKFTNAFSDYTVGTVIAVVLTALARREARLRASSPDGLRGVAS